MPTSAPRSPTDVLLVEDNPGDARRVMQWLSRPGFRVQHVAALDDASEQIQTHRYDAVLLDLGLPDSRGLETLSRLRRTEPCVAVVVLSAMDEPELGVATLDRGAQEYLHKESVDAGSLKSAIARAVVRQRTTTAGLQRLAAAREQSATLERALDEHPEAFMIFAPDGNVVYANKRAERAMGTRRGEPAPTELSCHVAPWNGIVTLHQSSGEPVQLAVRLVPMKWSGGHRATMALAGNLGEPMPSAPVAPFDRAILAANVRALAWRLEALRQRLRGDAFEPLPGLDALDLADELQFFVDDLERMVR